MGDIRNIYLIIITPRKEITSLSLFIIASKFWKNRRVRFRDLCIALITLFCKLSKKKLLLALRTANSDIS